MPRISVEPASGGSEASSPRSSRAPASVAPSNARKGGVLPARHLVVIVDRPRASGATPPAGSAQRRLTPREREVFRLLALGFTGGEVAERLVLSPHTVRRHVEKGIARLDANNRVQAIAIALTSGEIEL